MRSTLENPLLLKIAKQIAASTNVGWEPDNRSSSRRHIRCISFHQYMNACLYDSEYGYYRSGRTRIGVEGDFYTSSAVGQVLAEAIADHTLRNSSLVADKTQRLCFIEWGAGTGRLSAQIAAAGVKRSADWGETFQHILIEDHPRHAQAAEQAFAEEDVRMHRPVLVLRSEEAWKGNWLCEPAIVLANELLDAFPVHRVQRANGELIELGVAYDAEDGFRYVHMPLSDARIERWLVRDGVQLKEGQRTEVCPGAEDWLKQLGAMMKKGRLILIDYGHAAEEYAAPHRMDGTLMCYWKHQASDTPFERIGEQDITAHVQFTAVERAAEENGWRMLYYATQKQFLVDNGVLNQLQSHNDPDPFSAAARKNRAIRQLLLSDQMSEAFKVMILEK